MSERKQMYDIIETLYEDDNIFVGRVEWYGRPSRGIDIRNKDKSGLLSKGITLSDEYATKVAETLIGVDLQSNKVTTPKENKSPKKEKIEAVSFDSIFKRASGQSNKVQLEPSNKQGG